MANHPLDGIRAKLHRAEVHLATLDNNVNAFINVNPYSFRVENDPKTSQYVVYGRLTDSPNISLSVVIGDIVHNLRSALDHLVYQLALLNPAVSAPERTQFPIIDERDDYFGLNGKRPAGLNMVKPLFPVHQRAIHRLQPYYSFNNSTGYMLRALRELSNTDKHRLLPVIGAASLLTNISVGVRGSFRLPNYRVEIIDHGRMELEETPVAVMRFTNMGLRPSAADVDVNAKATVSVEFDNTELGRRGVVDFLGDLIKRVNRVVGIFESQFP